MLAVSTDRPVSLRTCAPPASNGQLGALAGRFDRLAWKALPPRRPPYWDAMFFAFMRSPREEKREDFQSPRSAQRPTVG